MKTMTAKEHLSLHDRQIAAIRALLQEGMRLMIETRKDLRATAALQKRTEESLQRMIDSRRTTNGHTKTKT
jgi:hypothetical protein